MIGNRFPSLSCRKCILRFQFEFKFCYRDKTNKIETSAWFSSIELRRYRIKIDSENFFCKKGRTKFWKTTRYFLHFLIWKSFPFLLSTNQDFRNWNFRTRKFCNKWEVRFSVTKGQLFVRPWISNPLLPVPEREMIIRNPFENLELKEIGLQMAEKITENL